MTKTITTANPVGQVSTEAHEAAVQLAQMLDEYRSVIEYDLMKYRLSSRALGIAHWDLDVADGNPLNFKNKFTWSRELRRMIGFNDDTDVVDEFTSLVERIHPDDIDMMLRTFADRVSGASEGTLCGIRYRIMKANGEYMHARAFGATQRDENGKPRRIAGAIADITAQIAAKERLRDIEKRSQMMLNSTPYAVTMWDSDFRVIDCSDTALDLFGFQTKQDLCDRLMHYAPEIQPCGTPSAAILAKKAAEAFETGSSRLEWTHFTTRGEEIVFDAIAKRVDYKGQNALMLHSRDIREEKRTQAELAEARKKETDAINRSNERLRAMLDAIPQSITMWDKDFRFIDCSQHTVDMFGHASKEEFRDTLENSVPEFQPCGRRSLDILREAADEALSTGRSCMKWTQKARNGDTILFDAKVIRVTHNGENAIMICSAELGRNVNDENS